MAITVTRQACIDLDACWWHGSMLYGNSRWRDLVSESDEIGLVELLELESVSVSDRVWVACRFLPDREARLLACDCAEHVLGRAESPDPRPVQAIAVARLFANGLATADELYAAYSAACDAAKYAAWYAAWSAAWYAASDAARPEAWHAAMAATRSAALAAANYAANCAARYAERKWQLAIATQYAKEL